MAFEGAGCSLNQMFQSGLQLLEIDIFKMALQLLGYLELSHQKGITCYEISNDTVFGCRTPTRKTYFTLTYSRSSDFSHLKVDGPSSDLI